MSPENARLVRQMRIIAEVTGWLLIVGAWIRWVASWVIGA